MPAAFLRSLLTGALFIGAAALPAFAEDAPAMFGDSAMGKVLVDHQGMTLYTFDKDSAGKSACNGDCAAAWPPLKAEAGAMGSGDWSVITRDDGSMQWAYKGKPLYLWVKDTKPGDTTGDKFKNVWHVVQP